MRTNLLEAHLESTEIYGLGISLATIVTDLQMRSWHFKKGFSDGQIVAAHIEGSRRTAHPLVAQNWVDYGFRTNSDPLIR